MIRPPRPGKNLTVDYRSALSGAQAGKGQSKEGSYLGGLTASQYAELFPDYFRRARPDIGISASGRLPGRQLPSAAALPGVGQPTTAAGRAAQRAQSGAPGTQPSGPSQQPAGAPVAPGWTPTEASRAGRLEQPTIRPPGTLNSLARERERFREELKDPELRRTVLALAASEVGPKADAESHRAIIESMMNRAAAQGRTLRATVEFKGSKSKDYYAPYHDGAYARNTSFLARNPDAAQNLDAQLEAVLAGTNVSNFATDNSSAHVARSAERSQTIAFKSKSGETFSRKDLSAHSDLHGAGVTRNNQTWYQRHRVAEEAQRKEEAERAKSQPADEEGGTLNKLDMVTPGMLAEAGAPPKTATPVAKGRKPPIGFGDSVMNGLLSKHKGMERGYAKDGAAPKQIFAQVQEWEKNNPGGLSGRDIHLSTGLLNNTGDVATARAMIEYLKSKGANVTLVGGPQGEGTRKDLVGVHAQVEALGKEFGVRVSPAYKPAEDGVHPTQEQLAKGFVELPKEATAYPKVEGLPSAPNIKGMKAEQLGETFPEGSQRFFHEGGGRNIDPRLVEVMKEASKDLPPGYHVRMFSGRDARATGTKNHPGGVAVDLAIVDDQGRRLNDRGFGHGHKIYEQLAHSMNERGKVMYPGTSYLWGGSWTAAGGDRMHYQIHDPKNPVSGASSSMTQYDWNTGVHRNHWAGVPDAWMTKDELNEYKTRIREKILQEQRAAAEEVQKEQATATPVRTIRAEDGQTKKLMFDTGRAYTESDVKTMMARYGKDLVIGANLDTPEEYEKVRALAEKYGLGIHGYSKGRGAPQSGWGNQFPREQQEIQKLARERGISLNQWYNGGWMDYEIDRLKKLGVKAPHQIELDNANDAKDGNAFEQELLKYAQAGLNTRIVPKNWGEREYAAYHKLVEQKKIPADIVVPLNITETKHIQGTEGVTKKAGHSFGPMPADNIGRYATTEPLQQPPPVQTEPVKQNAYGGVAQAYNSKEDVMFAQAGKGIIGGVAPGETIRYDKDGQITVVPGHRSDANALSDRSGKEADARVHAMTTIADANEHGSAMAMVPTPPQPSPQVGQSNVRTIDNPPPSPTHDRAMAKIKLDDHGGYAMQTSRIFSVI